MYSQRASRAVMCCAARMKSSLRQQVRNQSQSSSSHVNVRSLSLAANAWQQQMALREDPLPDNIISWATAGQESLRVEFGDGSVHEMPYAWLRNRCRCSKCSGAESGFMESSREEVRPEIIQRMQCGLVVDWSDGHISRYTADWLRSADFIPPVYSIHTYAEAT